MHFQRAVGCEVHEARVVFGAAVAPPQIQRINTGVLQARVRLSPTT